MMEGTLWHNDYLLAAWIHNIWQQQEQGIGLKGPITFVRLSFDLLDVPGVETISRTHARLKSCAPRFLRQTTVLLADHRPYMRHWSLSLVTVQ